MYYTYIVHNTEQEKRKIMQLTFWKSIRRQNKNNTKLLVGTNKGQKLIYHYLMMQMARLTLAVTNILITINL